VTAAIVAVAASTVPAAHADVTKDQCIDANTQAQALRRDGKLTAARAQLLKCGDPKCPAIIRDDCTQRLDELEHAQPTIVFDAKDGDGHDLAAVQVTVDGQPFADKLEGKALRVDPGAHTFVFTAAGHPPVTQSFVIREGEAERHERIVIGAPAAQSTTAGAPASSATALPATPPEPPPSSGLGTQRLLGIGVAGVGVVGIGVGAVFGLLASSAWNNAKNACGGDTSQCTDVSSANSYKSTTNTDGTISTVAFIAGGVLVAGGALLFFTGGGHETGHAASFWVSPTAAPGQGGAVVRGTF
jgi:hypothetical protein